MPQENLKDRVEGNEIDLSMSSLETVPVKELAALRKVTNVDLSCNLISSLPDDFCTLIHIIKLDLSKNSLTELPADFGSLSNLQHVDLLGNQLRTLPRSFCQLKKLRWLDLKDNPLEDDGLQKNAGDCLDEVQCKKCATRVLMYMTDLDEQLDIQWEKKMLKKKEEETKKRNKEEKEKQKKRAQKKAEKERRRKELENKRNQERLAQSDDTSDEDLKAETENLGSDKFSSHKDGRGRGNCFLFVLVSFLALLLALLVAIDVHCQASGQDQLCVAYWQPSRSNVTTALAASRTKLLQLYTAHIAPYFNK